MEATSFNLRQSIDGYINSLKAKGSITNSDAQELTAHLFDATSSLKAAGLSDDETFIIATKRLGKEELLTEEYSKVNGSINTNKVWAYVCIGFNWIFSIYTLLYIGIAFFYKLVYDKVQDVGNGSIIVAAFNVLICIITWYAVSKKNAISNFIEKQVTTNSIRTVFSSFVLLALVFVLSYNLRRYDLYKFLFYADYEFNTFAEMTFYSMFLNFGLAVLSIVFTINKYGNINLTSLFERPSTLFLILFGVLVELIAASTRAMGDLVVSYFSFGLIYMIASAMLTFHNKVNVKYLIVFSLFGILSEAFFGTLADISRGNTYRTLYFVGSLLIGIIVGRIIGNFMSKKRQAPVTS
jgi:hypothetical protein